ncbi:PP2C family protein-serine/threonine phosphatase [Candidatus Riflebacteria bacterium]
MTEEINNLKKEKPLILIVDDVPKNLQILGNILKKIDCRIAAATSGTRALSMVEKNPPDLILLDIMMPELDGFEVCRRIRSSKKTAEVPIIFLTAKTETEDMVKGFEVGAVDYVTKPFIPAELLARVGVFLHIKKVEDDLRDLSEKLTSELEQVGILQENMLEKFPHPELEKVSYRIFYQPAVYASGDYYEILPLKNGKYLLIMADVTGHGASAAVVMTTARIFIHELTSKGITGSEAISTLSNIIGNYLPIRYFLTMIYMIYDSNTGILTYCNCGHPPALINRKGKILFLESSTPPIGIGSFDYSLKDFTLEDGDRILLYTDGLYENDIGNFAGSYTDLIENYKSNLSLPISLCMDALLKSAFGVTSPTGLRDDVAIMLLDYKPGDFSTREK